MYFRCWWIRPCGIEDADSRLLGHNNRITHGEHIRIRHDITIHRIRELHSIMAHFAQLNADNKVTKVVVVANAVLDDNGVESESQGITHLQNLYGSDTVWKQCSYNNNFRRRYPGIGYTYDSDKDKFIEPRPYPNWTLDDNGDWQAPVAYPTDGERYMWDDANQQWIEFAD